MVQAIEFSKKQTYTKGNYFSHQNGKRCKTNSIRQKTDGRDSHKKAQRRTLSSTKKTKEIIRKNLEKWESLRKRLMMPTGEEFPYQFLLRSFDKKCKISRYSHTNVTINPKAANHDI